MVQEDFQKLVLEQFEKINSSLSSLKDDVSVLKTDVASLKDDVAVLKTDVAGLKDDMLEVKADISSLRDDVSVLQTDMTSVKTDVSTLKTDISTVKYDIAGLKVEMSDVKADMATKVQQEENSTLIRALMHNVELLHAKHDALALTTASQEAVERLDDKFDVLNDRLFQQETEIRHLKKVK